MENIDKNPVKIQQMFNNIAPFYDFLNNIISFYTHLLIKTKSIETLKIKPYSHVLDLCCGSGDMGNTIFKKYKCINIFGVDFSDKMLEIAKKKNKSIKYFKMDAVNLDFDDNYFDFVVMSFGLRNIEDKKACLKEIYRVLKPGGCFLQLDFGQKNLISKIYDKIILFLINFIKNKDSYLYLIKSKNAFDSPVDLIEQFKKAGFKFVKLKYFLFKNISAQVVEK